MNNLSGKTILLVDDEAELREILKEEFEFLGCRVLESENGARALEVLDREEVSAVISDVRMGGGNGLTLLSEIRQRNPRKPLVLLVTGFADITREEAIARGALGLIAKPFQMDTLVKAISDGLRKAGP